MQVRDANFFTPLFKRNWDLFFSRSSSLPLCVCFNDVLACIHEDQLLLSFASQVWFDCGAMERTRDANC